MANAAPPTSAKEVTFDDCFADKIQQLVIADGLAAELQVAYKHVAALPPMKPAGIASAVRTMEEVKRLTKQSTDGILFSATLSQLFIDERAVSTIDSGRIEYILKAASTDCQHR